MILATRYGGNQALRSLSPFGADTTRPMYGSGMGLPTYSGELVSGQSASGLAAVGRAIRLVSGLVASLPLLVYEGKRENRRERPDSAQAQVLAQPVAGMSDYDWRYDVASALEECENAYLLKVKDKAGRVVELYPVPAACMNAYLTTGGVKVFEVWTADGMAKLSSSQILHLRGQTLGGGPFGVSRIEQHRDPLGSQLAAQKFEGSYFRNHARPDIALLFGENVSQAQAREWRDFWTAQYGGAANAGQAVPLGGGADIKPIPTSTWRDAQFVESKGMGVEEAGRIMDVDAVLLGVVADGPARQAALDLFLRVQFMPRLQRISRGLRADLDLFPLTSPLYPAFEISDTVFADAATRAQIQHEQIQDGRRLVDEIRAEEGLGPLPPVPADWTQEPGKVPQITPVGGAANPTAETTPMDNSNAPSAPRGLTMPSVELRLEQDMEPLAREMGLAFSNVAATFGQFTAAVEGMQERAAAVDELRQRREAKRGDRADELAAAHAEALRQVGQPSIVVNVEPTPIVVENTVNVPEMPIQMQMMMPDHQEPPKKITVKRDPRTGLIESALVEDDG